MKYIDILKAKIEALESANSNLQSALIVCKDQENSFDNDDVYAVFRQNLDFESFNIMSSILCARTRLVSCQLRKVENLLIKAKEELNLIEWSELL